MKILSIGNSFSQDAQRYLRGVARAAGTDVKNVNLMIGGCSLERHYRNMKAEDRVYGLECGGLDTGFQVSLREALLSDYFDVVTLQQVSQGAPYFSTFEPYLSALAAYVRDLCPRAKIWIHETWGYEDGSARLTKELGYGKYTDMQNDVRDTAVRAAETVGAAGILPSGEAMRALLASGVRAHRDTFHASLGAGRYAIALTWAKTLMGIDPMQNTFRDFDVPVPEEEIRAAKESARDAAV